MIRAGRISSKIFQSFQSIGYAFYLCPVHLKQFGCDFRVQVIIFCQQDPHTVQGSRPRYLWFRNRGRGFKRMPGQLKHNLEVKLSPLVRLTPYLQFTAHCIYNTAADGKAKACPGALCTGRPNLLKGIKNPFLVFFRNPNAIVFY